MTTNDPTAPADAGDEAMVDELVSVVDYDSATCVDDARCIVEGCHAKRRAARAAILSRLASLRAEAASLSERLRSACEERGALEMEAERHVVASCVRAAMAEAERDAARSALAECQRERDEATEEYLVRGSLLDEAAEEMRDLRASLSRATERGERMREALRVIAAQSKHAAGCRMTFAPVAECTCWKTDPTEIAQDALDDDARDAAGGEVR